MSEKIQNRKKEIVSELKSLIGNGDEEINHKQADDLLCQLLLLYGEKEAVEAFEEIDKWYA